ncbi:MAG: HhH-GPD family protein [Candidatus Kaiserbacteria bacterium GW2011_GWA2_58_9]|uniref:Adenine DNA glycosylase n=1 Tax=Candidatus Kaiserbacteria bacterium GW2011_GWA2_58_9 TaxID=1618672 RepID=A0A0G1YR90_9BACT|nr:MAG: HhH-GPD family protein [Candidatus Kaiserbacteria bacterium GW2011_GWA2_58_9]
MLQQTQVPRVIGKYNEFLKKFPTVQALARAPLAKVLKVWSGLGYNRRAKFLRDAAVQIVEKYDGKVPCDYDSLRTLSGIGDYTARAIRVFAFNEPDTLLETNIRTVLIHHIYSDVLKNIGISDAELATVAREVATAQDPREWHWALMDYGAHLKKTGIRNNHKSAHYVRQSNFEGSLRQVRGQVLRDLMKGAKGRKGKKWAEALASLARDGLVAGQKGTWRIA